MKAKMTFSGIRERS